MKNNNHNELKVLANEFYGSKITQEEYFSRLDDIDCYQVHYLKARVYLDKQDLSNAMIEINTSIHMIEAYDENDLKCELGTFSLLCKYMFIELQEKYMQS